MMRMMGRPRKTEGVETTETSINRRWYYLAAVLFIVGIPFHQPLLIVTGLLLFLVLALTDIWASYCMHDLDYQRHLSEQRVLFGEEVTLSLSVENAKLLPLPWLETEDTMPRTLDIKEQELRSGLSTNMMTLECLFSPRWYERITRRYTLLCNTRGVHAIGPTKLRSGDVFGFLTREKTLSNRQYLLIYPLVAPLTSFNLPARHPFGERRAPRRLLEDPSRVIGTREYVYGDSLRRVNWKATARTMQLQSKVYEPTTTHTLILFLNTMARLDAHYGIHPELQELAISAAASISNWAIDEGYAVGLYANTIMFMPDVEEKKPVSEQAGGESSSTQQIQRRCIHLPASSRAEQRTRIMEVLARVQSYFGTNIEEVIQSERAKLPAGSTVVVITSVVNDVLIDTLARLRQSGHAVTILFVGDRAAPGKLAGITVYHIGGEDTWKQLETAYAAHSPAQTGITAIPGFQL